MNSALNPRNAKSSRSNRTRYKKNPRLNAKTAQRLKRISRVRQRRKLTKSVTKRYQFLARQQLRKFRQGSILAVAITSFLILMWESTISRAQLGTGEAINSVSEATGVVEELAKAFYSFAPKLIIAAIILFLGWLGSHIVSGIFRKTGRHGTRAKSLLALIQIGLFTLVLVAAFSILVGDVRALLGSLGLLGLALSWALQNPIESFTGWILNTFRGYYRVGDRVEVGEVLGDVYKIDVLTTMVWEIGGPGKSVSGAQPTGALITFPNSEVLRSSIINYSRYFPYIWDEVTVGIANESNLTYAVKAIRDIATEVIGKEMSESVSKYRHLLQKSGLPAEVEDGPQVYLSLTDSWTNCTIRYVVSINKRRKWSSRLIEHINTQLALPEHAKHIKPAYPRQENVIVNGR